MAETNQRENPLEENVGRLLLDLAKLAFGSFILGGILRGEIPQQTIVILGSIIFVVCGVAGIWLVSRRRR